MNIEKNKIIGLGLIFIWMVVSVLKLILFKTNSSDLIEVTLTVDCFFWLTSLLILLSFSYSSSFFISKKIFSIILLSLAAIVLFNYKIASFLYLLILWYSISNLISRRDFEKIYVAAYIFCFFCIALNVALNGQSFFYDFRYGYIPSFGFLNPNSFSQFIIVLYIFWVRNYFYSIILSIILYFTFKDIIFARSFYLILILQPLLLLGVKYIPEKILVMLPVMLFVCSIVLSLFLESDYGSFFNSMLSGRGYYSSLLISELNSIDKILFGVNKNMDDIPIDSSFVFLLYSYGLLAVSFFIFLYVRGLTIIYRSRNFSLIAVLISFLVYCFVENVLGSYFMNFTLYYIMSLIFVSSKINR